MYKRFLVFAMDRYYPSGGIDDVKKSFDDADEAIEFAKSGDDLVSYDFVEVFDCDLRGFIYKKNDDEYDN
jgi:hypothetical protein